MVIGAIGMNGANAQQNVVEVVRLGAEPAVTQHQLTVEQNAWEKLLKRSLATPTLVQVFDLNSKHILTLWIFPRLIFSVSR